MFIFNEKKLSKLFSSELIWFARKINFDAFLTYRCPSKLKNNEQK